MKAAVLNQLDGRFTVEDVEIGSPTGREVKVEIRASGLCHSDLHVAEADFGIPLPAVFGHEIAGVVCEVGPDATDFVVGDHVVASLIRFCGHCYPCLDGRTFQCDHPEETLRKPGDEPRLTRAGAPIEQAFGTGGFAEYAIVHENQLVAVPKELPFPQAALLGCGTVTGAGAVINTARVKTGETVVVLGVGGVGLNAIAAARLIGASRIIAVDNQPKKKALADKFGATDFINAADEDAVEAVHRLVPGGVDHSFEVIGIRKTAEQAIKMVRRGGSIFMIGAHTPGTPIALDVQADLIDGQKMIKGVYMGSSNFRHDIPMYANLYLTGRFNLDDLISKEINIKDINDAYAELKTGGIARSVITSF